MPGPPPAAGPRRPRLRWAWWLLAYASLGLGIAGLLLPVLPTTPFVLLAVWAASRGSGRLHGWLLAHPQFGPLIENWQQHGAVSRKAKWLATLSMALAAAILLRYMPLPGVRWFSLASMACVCFWLWRRPLPPGAWRRQADR